MKLFGNVKLFKAKLKGNLTLDSRILAVKDSVGITILESDLDYSSVTSGVKGVFGTVELYKVNSIGNVEFNSGNSAISFNTSEIYGDPKFENNIIVFRTDFFGSAKVNGSAGEGIVISDSAISDNPTISDTLTIRSALISDNGKYSGSFRQWYVISEIANGRFSGENDISGYYFLRKSISNSTIVGDSILKENGSHFTLTLDGTSEIGSGVDIRGVGSIPSMLGDGVKITGYPIKISVYEEYPETGYWVGGLLAYPLSTISGTNTTIEGSVYLGKNVKIQNDSTISGLHQRLDRGIPAIHLNSIIDNSTVSGGFYITKGNISNSTNISGTSYVCTSTLNNATLSCNAVTCGGTYSGNYSCGWYCNTQQEDGTAGFPQPCSIDDETGSFMSEFSEKDLIEIAIKQQRLTEELYYSENMYFRKKIKNKVKDIFLSKSVKPAHSQD